MPALVTPAQLAALPAWTRQRNQPSTYPRVFIEVAAERGVDRAQILAAAGLPDDLLDDPAGKLSLQDTWQLFAAVLELVGDPAFGFETGQRLPLTAHGSLGYALMCAATPRQAIGVLERFWHLRGRGVLMTFDEDEDGLFFSLAPEVATPTALRDFMFHSMLTSMYRAMLFMMPTMDTDNEIWFESAEPTGLDATRLALPRLRFGMPRSGIALHGDKAALDDPLPTANPEAFTQAIAQCERESALLDKGDDVLRQVRAALTPGTGGYPAPAELAASLHMTPRTFRRRLQEQGLSYQQLLDEARQRDSRMLLARDELEIRRIAELLGYADPANFTRAFRHWTGMSPRNWRKQKSRL